jgi:hypothetical protein
LKQVITDHCLCSDQTPGFSLALQRAGRP